MPSSAITPSRKPPIWNIMDHGETTRREGTALCSNWATVGKETAYTFSLLADQRPCFWLSAGQMKQSAVSAIYTTQCSLCKIILI
jgi:hypothetical protein